MEKKDKLAKKNLFIGVALVIIVSIAIYIYVKYDQYYPSTDDAYVSATIVNVAPKVKGYLDALYVKNDQWVESGDLLFALKQDDYDYNYAEAVSNYNSYAAQLTMAEKQLQVQQALIAKDKSQQQLAISTHNRYDKLYTGQALAKALLEEANNNLTQANSQLQVDQEKYQQDLDLIQFIKAKMAQAKATTANAKLNINYTKYYAATSGYITNLQTLSAGEFINIGQQLFAIVNGNSWWVEANFKETQLKRLGLGQRVQVVLDMYDNHVYHGIITSISYASGSSFSLLPAQNATGNWVKITQRFPVRISIANESGFPLRVGASAKVTVNTRS